MWHQAQSEDGKDCAVCHPHSSEISNCIYKPFLFFSIMNDPSYLARGGGERELHQYKGQDFFGQKLMPSKFPPPTLPWKKVIP